MKRAPINTRKGKRAFIRSLTGSVQRALLAAVPQMPADWDGHELRELIAEVFDGERSRGMRHPRREGWTKRAKSYASDRAAIGKV